MKQFSKSFSILWPLLVLLALSCQENPAVRLRYDAEKKLHQADRQLRQIQAFNQNLTLDQVRQVYPAYREAVDFCFASLDSIDAGIYPTETNELKYIAYESSARLARLLLSVQQFDSSIAILNRLIRDVPLDERQLLPTYLNLGQALQLSGQWDSALVVYNFTIRQFYPPLGNNGALIMEAFNLPIHLYRMASFLNDSASIRREFSKAEDYYGNLIEEYPGTVLSSTSHIVLADLYDAAGMWDKVLRELNAVADPVEPNYDAVLARTADVLGGRLKKYDTAIALYDNILNRLDPLDTVMAPEIKFKIALAWLDQKKYDQARQIILDIKKDYPRFYGTTPIPQYTVARSLELQGNWPRAEQEYNLLIEKYRGSDEAMMAHLNAIDYLKNHNRRAEADLWYEKAEKYFNELILREMGTPREARALFYKADLRRRNDEFNGAAEILVSLFQKFPESEPGRRAMIGAASLYRDKLNNPQKADSLIEVLKQHLANVTAQLQNQDLFAD